MESYTKKDGTPSEYNRITRVDYHESVKNIRKKLLETADPYFKHRTYVDNVSTVFPETKSAYDGKYVEWTSLKILPCVLRMKFSQHTFQGSSLLFIVQL